MTVPVDMMPKVMRVLTLLGQGYTLTKACRAEGISTTTFNRHVRSVPELKELHEEALQEGGDALADILLEIDSNPTYGSSDPQKMKVLSDNIKWVLSRRRPTQYGDKVTVQHNVTADAAIVEALAQGRQRATSVQLESVSPQIEDAAFDIIEDTVLDAFDLKSFV